MSQLDALRAELNAKARLSSSVSLHEPPKLRRRFSEALDAPSAPQMSGRDGALSPSEARNAASALQQASSPHLSQFRAQI